MTLEEMLAEAQTALHQLMIGRRSVKVIADGGYTIEYTAANIVKLKAYIAELQAQIAGLSVKGAVLPIWGS
jgi:hypothetical protein